MRQNFLSNQKEREKKKKRDRHLMINRQMKNIYLLKSKCKKKKEKKESIKSKLRKFNIRGK